MHTPVYPFGGVSASQGELWPRPPDLWGWNLYDDALLFERAPFMSQEGLHDADLIRAYATAIGELPGGLSVADAGSSNFTHRLVL